mmetsp:Transcript_78234/g.207617  ORF Transcript_78234/g.207617 Transcript_78234/m.207617 type:complete len:292 (-) Transcript_78234:1-876(-)
MRDRSMRHTESADGVAAAPPSPRRTVHRSLLCELDLQRHLWGHHEALQTVLGDARLQLIGVLNEGNIAALDQARLLEARVLPEEHREHHLVDLRRQILHEEHVRGLPFTRGGGWARTRMRHKLGRSRWCASPCCNRRRIAFVPGNWRRSSSLLRLLLFGLCCPRLEGPILDRYHVGLCPGVVDSHGLVQEDEPLQGPQRVGGAGNIPVHDEGLALLLQGPGGNDVHDLAIRAEELEETALQVRNLDLVVDVVHVQRLVRRHIAIPHRTAAGTPAIHLCVGKRARGTSRAAA